MKTELVTRSKYAVSALINGLPKKPHPFRPYIIKPVFGDLTFDFIVPDEETKTWYDHKYDNVPPEIQMYIKLTKPNFNVLEIGVHNGFLASMFSKLLDARGKYTGIELMPNCYMAALAQLKLNKAESNFQVINAAAGDADGVNYYADIESGNGMVSQDGNGIKVQQVAGDSLLGFFDNKIDLLKIDVEGFELQVLKGCKKILEQSPSISIELHFTAWATYNTKIEDIFNLIDLNLYHAYYFCNKNSGNTDGILEPEKIRPFILKELPKAENMNVFLFSKKNFLISPF